MRFQFCWDTDCPDWLLAQVAALSNLQACSIERLAALAVQGILGQPLAKEEVEVAAEGGDSSACLGAVTWVMRRAAGAEVAADTLDAELQQLGLPPPHAAALAAVYAEAAARLTAAAAAPRAANCVGGGLRSKVAVQEFEGRPVAVLTLGHGPGRDAVVALSPDSLDGLVAGLTEALTRVRALESQSS